MNINLIWWWNEKKRKKQVYWSIWNDNVKLIIFSLVTSVIFFLLRECKHLIIRIIKKLKKSQKTTNSSLDRSFEMDRKLPFRAIFFFQFLFHYTDIHMIGLTWLIELSERERQRENRKNPSFIFTWWKFWWKKKLPLSHMTNRINFFFWKKKTL